ncbi:MAG: ABC transporter permease [Acidobacteriia bacterium]|nr:ABC transporter permease [Terriglobia bacterium]
MFLRDWTLAWRKFVRRPGAAVLAVLSLALAIGFSTAAFSVVDAYYWRALPVKQPDRLAYAMVRDREGRFAEISWQEFESIQRETVTLAGIAVQDRQGPPVRLEDRLDFPITAGVSDNYFDVIGVAAALGQVFHGGGGADGQLVVTDRYWKTAFGGDLKICGRTVQVGRAALTIIGVLPPGFSGTLRGVAVDLFVPHQTVFGSLRMASPTNPKDTEFEPLLRLKPGVGLEAARRDMDQVLRRREAAGVAPEAGRTAFVLSFTRPESTPETTPGDVFPWIVALVLAIAAANFANLRLVENQLRRRETGIRLALGAGRWGLLRQHLTESLLLSGMATALGLLLAAWLVDLAPAVLYSGRRYTEYFIRLDGRVFAFSAAAMLLVAAIGTLIPLRDVWRSGVVPALQAVAAPSASRWLAALVVLQMCLITVVADATGLLWRTLGNVAAIRPAMDPDRRVLIVAGGWTADGALAARAQRLAAELGAIPGVVRVAYARRVMLWGSGVGARTAYERPGEPKATFRFNQVSANYFAATGARILAGRPFSDGDGPDAAPVAMLSEAFTRQFFPRGDALGSWVRLDGQDRQVVGIVEDGPSKNLKEAIEPFVYFPYAQRPSADLTLLVETARDPGRVAPLARDRLRTAAAAFTATDFLTLAQHLRASRETEEVAASVSGGMALLSVVLAAAGLFGVMLYAVSRRTREFGVRVALGATPALLGRQVMREALRLAAAGVVLGVLLSLAGARLLGNLLYGVQARDYLVLTGACAAVVLLALAAALVPARRAAHADPIAALRVE